MNLFVQQQRQQQRTTTTFVLVVAFVLLEVIVSLLMIDGGLAEAFNFSSGSTTNYHSQTTRPTTRTTLFSSSSSSSSTRFISSLTTTTTTTNRMTSRKTLATQLQFSPLLVEGDHDDGNSHSTLTSLDMVAADSSALDSGVLKKLDREMSETARKRQKLEMELAKVQSLLKEETTKLEEIEIRRNQYLNGASIGVLPEERNFSETTARSAVKAMCWRIIAGSVTFITALRFSGSLQQAFKIVGSDFFSKSFTMFLGERLMNKSKAGRKGGADNVGRSLAKALLWRLFAIANTLTMAIFIAKDIKIASKIAGSDAIVKTAMMFAYERVWANIDWGKEYTIEFSI